MAVALEHAPITTFEQWYEGRSENARDGCLEFRNLSRAASGILDMYTRYKREMDARVANYEKFEMLADSEVISPKDDLPNISSGETAGIVRRMARNLVQHTPNLEIVCEHDDDSLKGVIARFILLTKIVGSDTYSSDMQQNLFASTKTSLTLGFACVVPVLLQDASGSWYVKYDSIHYRDVFPEPGAKDVREATSVFVRRYLTRGEVLSLIRNQVSGWDLAALRRLAQQPPRPREYSSVAHQDKKHKTVPEGYEIVTWYTSSGDPFLTFDPHTQMLLRIEVNRHPLKWHPVHFLVLEKDDQQPLGKSQVELLLGRQEFQDLMLNGAMKMWYRNINPPLVGYGVVNAIPNLGPGKYTEITNPNARIEPFEVNTQTLLQFGTISQQNHGAMVNLVGAADQQMAASAGQGMSATPQGVESQDRLVDITTNNYQKAIESFFSHYCSYALTLYFHELQGTEWITPSADARQRLIALGLDEDLIKPDGSIDIKFSEMATEYYVRCVPGSLVEMEDEKQLRILKEIFVPLSQAIPAFAAAGDTKAVAHSAAAIQYMVEKTLELAGSTHARELKEILQNGRTGELDEFMQRTDALETEISGLSEEVLRGMDASADLMAQMQEQIRTLAETQRLILSRLGVSIEGSGEQPNTSAEPIPTATA